MTDHPYFSMSESRRNEFEAALGGVLGVRAIDREKAEIHVDDDEDGRAAARQLRARGFKVKRLVKTDDGWRAM